MGENAALVILAAGGTGGHVFPAEALARELLGRGFQVVLFTDRRGSAFGQDLTVPLYRIRASVLGHGIVGRIKSVVEMGIGYIQARALIKKLKPAAVVGFGGYPSVPTVYAASRAGIPIVLHEQNAILGRANNVMLNWAKCLATSFPHVKGIKSTDAQIVHTGNPVRPSFAVMRATPFPALVDNSPFKILVLGGSLGAKVFSQVIPQALALLPHHLKRRLVVAQQCRQADIDDARTAYASTGIEVELSTFFHDIPERMAESHLLISRSGGSTIAEITAVGRPSILVPFPHGHAGEQIANAEAVTEAGGGWLIPEQAFTPESLAVRLESLMTLPANLSKTAAAARAWGTTKAADNLADCVQSAMGHKIETTYSMNEKNA